MNGEYAATMIYAALAILYVIAVQGITYRLVFVDFSTRICPDAVFYEVVIENQADDWNKLRNRWSRAACQFGWLAACFQMETPARAAAQARRFDRQQHSYLNALRLVCSLSTLFGLLGTVSGFLVAEDISEVGLNTAFMTTFWGIVIGVPPAVYLGFTKSRRESLESQVDLFLDRLKQTGTNRSWSQSRLPPPPPPPPKSQRSRSPDTLKRFNGRRVNDLPNQRNGIPIRPYPRLPIVKLSEEEVCEWLREEAESLERAR